jgi:ribosome biogenesis GTPase
MKNNEGQVYKIHSDFYYVKVGKEIVECKLREIIKKQNLTVCVGDFVEIENNSITKILNRINFISRPNIANLDLLIIVSPIKEPDLNLSQLNRYLTFAKIHKIPCALCFNKEDLPHDDCLKDKITSIYKALKCKILFTSALKKTGIEDLRKLIKGKTVALCGQSGVGKSSVLNALNESLNIKTGALSKKQPRGVHTTRHCEIIEFGNFKIADTPGFSNLKFDFVLPQDLGDYFDEIKKYKSKCKFANCLHEEGTKECGVIENLDNINISRYESYLEFLEEAKEYKKRIDKQGYKKETGSKKNIGKIVPKISAKKRQSARNTQKQRLDYD